jgi:hypothetical protein
MRLYVPLTRTEFDRLREVAQAERRRPQDQAAVILAQALDDELPRSEFDSTQHSRESAYTSGEHESGTP